jgi:hypothetical protein
MFNASTIAEVGDVCRSQDRDMVLKMANKRSAFRIAGKEPKNWMNLKS